MRASLSMMAFVLSSPFAVLLTMWDWDTRIMSQPVKDVLTGKFQTNAATKQSPDIGLVKM